MSRQIRSIALALTLALLAAGAVQAWPAAGARPVQAAPEAGLFAAAWDRLVSVFVGLEAPASREDSGTVPQKAGCGMDPDGLLHSLLCN